MFYEDLATNPVSDIKFYITPDVGLLSSLTTFHIVQTGLAGSLPESIGLWTNLTDFDVSGNALVGTLPLAMDRWTKLDRCPHSLETGGPCRDSARITIT
jgi:hypothetical protein